MGSTLRSLVLRYKADIKEFQKGNRRVIDDLKSSKREVVSLDKEMKRTFAPKIDKAREQIRRLNEQFRAGRMDVHKYGTAVDALKQKIAAMNRVSQITSSEVGALRARRVKAAVIDKELASNFRGTMAESADAIRARMSAADVWGGGGTAAAVAAGGFRVPKNFGALGKIAKVAGPTAAIGTVAYRGVSRGQELAAGERSDLLGGSLSTSVGDTHRALFGAGGSIGSLIDDLSSSYIAGVAQISTYGMAGKYGRHLKAGDDNIARSTVLNEAAAERRKLFDAARGPVDELRAEQRINELTKERDALGVAELARAAERNDNLEDAARLWAKVAEYEKESVVRNEARAQAQRAYKDSLTQSVNDAERELRIARDIAGGATPREAAMREAGGTREQTLRMRGIDRALADLDKGGGPDSLMDFIGKGQSAIASGWKWFQERQRQAAHDKQTVGQFAAQFDTPQEAFQRNLREIQNMMTLGLDPAIAQRAMRANAAGLAGSQRALSRFAPSAEVGSREEMMMRDQAKAAGKEEKRVAELVEVQKKALDKLGKIADGGAVKIEIMEVSI